MLSWSNSNETSLLDGVKFRQLRNCKFREKRPLVASVDYATEFNSLEAALAAALDNELCGGVYQEGSGLPFVLIEDVHTTRLTCRRKHALTPIRKATQRSCDLCGFHIRGATFCCKECDFDMCIWCAKGQDKRHNMEARASVFEAQALASCWQKHIEPVPVNDEGARVRLGDPGSGSYVSLDGSVVKGQAIYCHRLIDGKRCGLNGHQCSHCAGGCYAMTVDGPFMCSNGHRLNFIAPQNHSGDWACDGRTFFANGCRSKITDFYQAHGFPRYRCQRCDYDLCENCVLISNSERRNQEREALMRGGDEEIEDDSLDEYRETCSSDAEDDWTHNRAHLQFPISVDGDSNDLPDLPDYPFTQIVLQPSKERSRFALRANNISRLLNGRYNANAALRYLPDGAGRVHWKDDISIKWTALPSPVQFIAHPGKLLRTHVFKSDAAPERYATLQQAQARIREFPTYWGGITRDADTQGMYELRRGRVPLDDPGAKRSQCTNQHDLTVVYANRNVPDPALPRVNCDVCFHGIDYSKEDGYHCDQCQDFDMCVMCGPPIQNASPMQAHARPQKGAALDIPTCSWLVTYSGKRHAVKAPHGYWLGEIPNDSSSVLVSFGVYRPKNNLELERTFSDFDTALKWAKEFPGRIGGLQFHEGHWLPMRSNLLCKRDASQLQLPNEREGECFIFYDELPKQEEIWEVKEEAKEKEDVAKPLSGVYKLGPITSVGGMFALTKAQVSAEIAKMKGKSKEALTPFVVTTQSEAQLPDHPFFSFEFNNRAAGSRNSYSPAFQIQGVKDESSAFIAHFHVTVTVGCENGHLMHSLPPSRQRLYSCAICRKKQGDELPPLVELSRCNACDYNRCADCTSTVNLAPLPKDLDVVWTCCGSPPKVKEEVKADLEAIYDFPGTRVQLLYDDFRAREDLTTPNVVWWTPYAHDDPNNANRALENFREHPEQPTYLYNQGQMLLRDNVIFLVREQLNPEAVGGLILTGRFELSGPKDRVQIYTRTCGTLRKPPERGRAKARGELETGIKFVIGHRQVRIELQGADESSNRVLSATSPFESRIRGAFGRIYEFEVIDTGSKMSLAVWEVTREHRLSEESAKEQVALNIRSDTLFFADKPSVLKRVSEENSAARKEQVKVTAFYDKPHDYHHIAITGLDLEEKIKVPTFIVRGEKWEKRGLADKLFKAPWGMRTNMKRKQAYDAVINGVKEPSEELKAEAQAAADRVPTQTVGRLDGEELKYTYTNSKACRKLDRFSDYHVVVLTNKRIFKINDGNVWDCIEFDKILETDIEIRGCCRFDKIVMRHPDNPDDRMPEYRDLPPGWWSDEARKDQIWDTLGISSLEVTMWFREQVERELQQSLKRRRLAEYDQLRRKQAESTYKAGAAAAAAPSQLEKASLEEMRPSEGKDARLFFFRAFSAATWEHTMITTRDLEYRSLTAPINRPGGIPSHDVMATVTYGDGDQRWRLEKETRDGFLYFRVASELESEPIKYLTLNTGRTLPPLKLKSGAIAPAEDANKGPREAMILLAPKIKAKSKNIGEDAQLWQLLHRGAGFFEFINKQHRNLLLGMRHLHRGDDRGVRVVALERGPNVLPDSKEMPPGCRANGRTTWRLSLQLNTKKAGEREAEFRDLALLRTIMDLQMERQKIGAQIAGAQYTQADRDNVQRRIDKMQAGRAYPTKLEDKRTVQSLTDSACRFDSNRLRRWNEVFPTQLPMEISRRSLGFDSYCYYWLGMAAQASNQKPTSEADTKAKSSEPTGCAKLCRRQKPERSAAANPESASLLGKGDAGDESGGGLCGCCASKSKGPRIEDDDEEVEVVRYSKCAMCCRSCINRLPLPAENSPFSMGRLIGLFIFVLTIALNVYGIVNRWVSRPDRDAALSYNLASIVLAWLEFIAVCCATVLVLMCMLYLHRTRKHKDKWGIDVAKTMILMREGTVFLSDFSVLKMLSLKATAVDKLAVFKAQATKDSDDEDDGSLFDQIQSIATMVMMVLLGIFLSGLGVVAVVIKVAQVATIPPDPRDWSFSDWINMLSFVNSIVSIVRPNAIKMNAVLLLVFSGFDAKWDADELQTKDHYWNLLALDLHRQGIWGDLLFVLINEKDIQNLMYNRPSDTDVVKKSRSHNPIKNTGLRRPWPPQAHWLAFVTGLAVATTLFYFGVACIVDEHRSYCGASGYYTGRTMLALGIFVFVLLLGIVRSARVPCNCRTLPMLPVGKDETLLPCRLPACCRLCCKKKIDDEALVEMELAQVEMLRPTTAGDEVLDKQDTSLGEGIGGDMEAEQQLLRDELAANKALTEDYPEGTIPTSIYWIGFVVVMVIVGTLVFGSTCINDSEFCGPAAVAGGAVLLAVACCGLVVLFILWRRMVSSETLLPEALREWCDDASIFTVLLAIFFGWCLLIGFGATCIASGDYCGVGGQAGGYAMVGIAAAVFILFFMLLAAADEPLCRRISMMINFIAVGLLAGFGGACVQNGDYCGAVEFVANANASLPGTLEELTGFGGGVAMCVASGVVAAFSVLYYKVLVPED